MVETINLLWSLSVKEFIQLISDAELSAWDWSLSDLEHSVHVWNL